MDWKNQQIVLKDFDGMVTEASSQISDLVKKLMKEDIKNKYNESQSERFCQTSVSNTSIPPLHCEVLSKIEKTGLDSLDSFSFTKREIENHSPDYWLGSKTEKSGLDSLDSFSFAEMEYENHPPENCFSSRASPSRELIGVFQPYCRIAIFNEKLQLQQEILCSLNSTLEDLYRELFCCNTTIATNHLKDCSRNFLFCFENNFYTRLESWGSNEYIRNFEDFVRRENLETEYGKDFLREIVINEAQGVQLGNLSIRFGVPYALLHLGDCEHKLIFQDLFADLCEEYQSVCKTVFLKPPKPRTCGVCRIKSSVVVCHNHQLADANPYFLCCDCYERVKYDANPADIYHLHSEHPSVFE
ncbi:hypothetical protein GpartN1_g3430.t1 [Galdieria partita]|uniref:snRNA-activating protein complex subunit 3 n=1 Tax=Galdieria partita TaxID=83374 RepID=A0A9C7PWC1_9RHOD|nr:hypothetical protein GpartN1_g3430.t1 [Galdieria partita]